MREAITESVGKPVADTASLLENGLDSLGSVSLRTRLATRFKINLPSAFLFEYPDIHSIVRYISSLSSSDTLTKTSHQSRSKLPVLVIGAGIGGLSFARQLEKAGIPTLVMEKSNAVGGVWNWLANNSSKLQIDSPAYDFDSTLMPLPGGHQWKNTFPEQSEILAGCKKVAEELAKPVLLNTRVLKVRKINDSEYEVNYVNNGQENITHVSGIAAMTGGLHRPSLHIFPNEKSF